MLRVVAFGIRLARVFCRGDTPFQDQYDVGKVIIKGKFATIRKCRAVGTKKELAVKIYDMRDFDREEQCTRAMDEVSIHHTVVKHRHVVHFHGSHYENFHIYIVLSLLNGPYIFEGLISRGSCSESDAAYYMEQIMSGIRYLHSCHVVHADLKPENIMFKGQWHRSSVKIIDFGSAISIPKKGPQNRKFGMRGCAEYRAPEMVKDKEYGRAIDVWSAGVLLCNLLTGIAPFEAATEKDIHKNIESTNIDYKAPEWKSVAKQARNLVLKLLMVDPRFRFTANQALGHPFLRGHGLSSFLSKKTEKHVIRGLVRLHRCRKRLIVSAPIRSRIRTVSDPVSDRLEYMGVSLKHLTLRDVEKPYLHQVETTNRRPKVTAVSGGGLNRYIAVTVANDFQLLVFSIYSRLRQI